MYKSEAITLNLCDCGCGQDAGFYQYTNRQQGVTRGKPRKFIRGHNTQKTGKLHSCNVCGAGVWRVPSETFDIITCSLKCKAIERERRRREGKERQCTECGLWFYRPPSLEAKYCSRLCQGRSIKGEKHPNWTGVGSITPEGYHRITVAGKGSIYEHRHVMEENLQRRLSTSEHVHHLNGDKLDNRLENLEITTLYEHPRLHKIDTWSRKQETCANCGRSDRPHKARGLCNVCHVAQYNQVPLSVLTATYGTLCYLCSLEPATAVEHMTPLSRGGTNDLDNLRPACASCNSKKSGKTYEEYVASTA